SHSGPMAPRRLDCDFETYLCGWLVVGRGGQQRSNWFKTNDPDIEPGKDHTGMKMPRPTHYGNSLTTHLSEPSNTPYDSILQSGQPLNHSASTTYCLTFWYYYFGIERANFTVYISSNSSLQKAIPLWRRNLPTERSWQQAFIEIGK